jgi:hypothetical protein
MLNLMRAEWKKTTGNRMAAGLLVWIFPIGAIALSILSFVVLFFSESYRTTMGMQTAYWQRSFETGWGIVNSEVGRGIMLVFAAITLAGEYVWGTWKNIIPRSRRWKLLLAKFIMISLVMVFSYLIFTLVIGFTDTLLKVTSGASISPDINGETLRETATTYLVQAGTSFGAAWIAVGYAAIAAMLTRSVVGSIVISFLALLAEQAVLVVCFMLIQLLGFSEQILYVYYFTPSYNFTNINSWILSGIPFNPFQFNTGGMALNFMPHSLAGSIAIIAVYVVLIALFVILLFRRQDITS